MAWWPCCILHHVTNWIKLAGCAAGDSAKADQQDGGRAELVEELDGGHSRLLASMEGIYQASGKSAATPADCPVCRKPHLLDLDQLQVCTSRVHPSVIAHTEQSLEQMRGIETSASISHAGV